MGEYGRCDECGKMNDISLLAKEDLIKPHKHLNSWPRFVKVCHDCRKKLTKEKTDG